MIWRVENSGYRLWGDTHSNFLWWKMETGIIYLSQIWQDIIQMWRENWIFRSMLQMNKGCGEKIKKYKVWTRVEAIALALSLYLYLNGKAQI